jgi:hypothetical protein
MEAAMFRVLLRISRQALLAMVLLALAALFGARATLTVAQEGEHPEWPRSDDVEAFPVVPVEPGDGGPSPSGALANGVLIVQDSLPWGYNSIQQFLANHGVAYTTILSSELAAHNLTPYGLIIVPSIQGDDFYNYWNASLAKIEAFVDAGGKLWLSACTLGGVSPLAPGGVASTFSTASYNEVADALHPWMWGAPEVIYGTGASHNHLSNLYPGSKVLARVQGSGEPVLVDYRYGAGRVFLSGMTMEYGYNLHQNLKPILVNSLANLLGLNPIRALIVQDSYPWGSTGIQDTLDRLRVGFHQVSSAGMASVDLRPYDLVIIPSDQTAGYYSTWNSNYSRFHSFAGSGSKLWLSAANQSGQPEPVLPGGVVGGDDFQNYNLVVAPGHRWVRGAPARMYGTSVSHDSFTSLVAGSIVVVEAESTGKPTLVDYRYGSGRVLINGLTLEHAYLHNRDHKPILANSLRDMLGLPLAVYLPGVLNNFVYCYGGPGESEPNNTAGAAVGSLCSGAVITGSPKNDAGNEEDWFYIDWGGVGTLTVNVTSFPTQAGLFLYRDSTANLVRSQQNEADGTYQVQCVGGACGGGGMYLIRLFVPEAAKASAPNNYQLTATISP